MHLVAGRVPERRVAGGRHTLPSLQIEILLFALGCDEIGTMAAVPGEFEARAFERAAAE